MLKTLITRRGAHFYEGRARFRMTGANAYYLLHETTRELLGNKPLKTADEVFRKLSAAGVNTVRTLACMDTPDKDACLQRAPDKLDATALSALDHVIASASKHKIRLIMVLCNYWDDYGGVDQYLRWNGYKAEKPKHRGAFFVEEDIRQHYRVQITRILTRKNEVSGIVYGDDPAIVAWELMNEPRGTGSSYKDVAAWVGEMASLVRDQSAQLVGTGESGYDDWGRKNDDANFLRSRVGRWVANGHHDISLRANSEHVDYVSVHSYPESWKADKENAEKIGDAWMRLGKTVATDLDLPMVLGEFGLINDDDFPELGKFGIDDRRAIYKRWFDWGKQHDVAMLPWLFVPDARPTNWDRFSFRWHDNTQPADPINKYMDLLIDHA